MIRLEFTTVIGCKNMCKYCPQILTIKNYKGGDKRIMSLETFKACIDNAPKNSEITFSGFAEPFLNPHCIEMIEYAHGKKHPVSLYTTLVGASKDDITRLGKMRFRDFVLHLPDNDMALQIDQDYLDRLKLATDLDISATNEKYAVCFGKIDQRIIDIIGAKMPFLDQSIPHTRAGNVKASDIRRKGTITCRRCGNSLNQNIILPDGSVVLCCMDFGQKHVLGNLLLQNYDEILNSPEKKRILDGFKDENSDILCRTCESSISISKDGLKGTLLYLNSRKKELF
ncbi:MAG: SPASM domain-containing protein [Candidatus Micrarchaeota archaeon]|nr:SPASM domain-containing protein [Candidatus Micrarchaeota archaeon]